jgi:nitroreductase
MNILHKIASEKRPNPEGILEDILYRWSPRVFSDKSVSEKDLQPLFEAARWAPSSSNNQEWLYYYALHDDQTFPHFVDLMDDGNRKKYPKSGALIVVVSKTISSHKNYPIPSHSFDAGMSFLNFAIEGVRRGLVVHPMGGFDKVKAKELLKLDDDKHVEIMVAVGYPGEESLLRTEREVTLRNEIETFTFHVETRE